MSKFQGHQTTAPSILADAAAVGALSGDQSSVANLRDSLVDKRDTLVSELNNIPGVKAFKSEGTFYCFADISHYSTDSLKMAEYIIEKAKVITVPGIAFGIDGYLRISFCRDVDELKKGVDLIKDALISY